MRLAGLSSPISHNPRPQRLTAVRRTAAVVLLSLLAIYAALFAAASPSYAEPGDRITSYDIQYDVQANGDVKVTETIDYSFAGYGRHGIYRYLITRGEADADRDRVYEISGFSVSSPTGAPTDVSESTEVADDGRTYYEKYQIGSQDLTVDQAETYVLTYTISGALNPQENADTELYWNATGNQWDADIEAVTVAVTAPGGVQQVTCFAGPRGSEDPCESAEISGEDASYSASNLSYGSEMTIVAGLDPAEVAANPVYESPPSWTDRNGFTPVNIGLGVVALGLVSAYGVRSQRRARDMRFVGVPPGVVPSAAELKARGNGVGQKPDDGTINPPVAFSPPRDVSPAEASYLRRPGPDSDQLAATILDLAYRGAIRIVGDDDDDRTLVAADLSRATAAHEKRLVNALFRGGRTEVSLNYEPKPGVAGPLNKAEEVFKSGLVERIAQDKFFNGPVVGGGRKALAAFGWLLIGAGAIGAFFGLMTTSEPGGATAFTWWGLVALIAGIILLVLSRTGEGQGRTAVGRAVMDQIEGFELYLRTAEADQLKFEEGEDIYSRYLPWAVVFDITHRWSRVCSQLIAEGRIPAQPAWYSGPWDPMHTYVWVAAFNSNVSSSTASAPPMPSSSVGGSGTGFGGSSGFSGGFSGGGGGGGGGGSW
ncbi:DUF2207 domain-containing protein [Epidermidibacterium keratini]|uniref:DUF2207 domain-containing protein n=1 Tax=Epidermidibacterium keratini TaxID=1891644 RepID=UPI0018658A59|nr:DUF2207 domain-containing protein [Epidermidibacterium keratini]